jgi:hypothetical protein
MRNDEKKQKADLRRRRIFLCYTIIHVFHRLFPPLLSFRFRMHTQDKVPEYHVTASSSAFPFPGGGAGGGRGSDLVQL